MTSRMLAMEMVKKLGRHRCTNSEGWPDADCGCTQSAGPLTQYNQGNGCPELKQMLQVLRYLSDGEFDYIMEGKEEDL